MLYCDNDECKGDRFFECSDDKCTYQKLGWDDHLLYYTCCNCESNQKSDAIRVGLENKNGNGYVIKLGEIPPYGPFTPSRLIKFVGKDRELFLTGRRAESQGMGIGSFSYYRRVVENQKDRIFDEIIRVMQKIGAPEKQIEDFKTLKNEFQFKKAVDSIKVTLLDTLLIKPIKDFPKVYLSLNNSFRKDLQALAQFAPKPEPPDLSDYIKEVYGKNDKK